MDIRLQRQAWCHGGRAAESKGNITPCPRSLPRNIRLADKAQTDGRIGLVCGSHPRQRS